MLEKLIQLLLTYIVLPLLLQGWDSIVAYVKKMQAEGKTNQEIDSAVDDMEKSTTKEEQKDALKKLVEGIRRRRAERV